MRGPRESIEGTEEERLLFVARWEMWSGLRL